jgi:hypothetical protein
MLGLDVVVRKWAARRVSKIGPYVSGMKRSGGRQAPAIMRPIQNVQRQPRAGETKPEMMGAKSGPTLVAWNSQLWTIP